MTALPLSPHTHSVPSLDSTVLSANVTPPLPSAQPVNGIEDEEDYTIKCICDFPRDDGSTILCETCQTWQHIGCYYASQGIPTPGEDEEHYCDECDPQRKHLNKKLAAEWQRAKLNGADLSNPKLKRSTASKSNKRKKAADHLTNGTNGDKHDNHTRNGVNGSPRDHPPASKRPKASHRSSNSVQIVPLKLPAHSSRRSTSASHTLQSPSKGSQKNSHIEGEPYSSDFMHLYDNDPGETDMEGNLMNDITTANNLSLWSHDADAVEEATNGRSYQEVFQRSNQPVDEIEKPIIKKHIDVDETREFHGRHPKFTFLTVESETPEEATVGELRGKIGLLEDYVKDETNRWEYLRHPVPFVFFHPSLPIYIDTRQGGTIFRYVRRSCKPNLRLMTILENGSEMRFCLRTTKDLHPGQELTLAWTPDEHVRAYLFQDQAEDENVSFQKQNYLREYYAKVLSDYGGCACESPETCINTQWSRHSEQKGINGATKNGQRGGGRHSSNSNGRTSISRSGSEALKNQDDDEQDDDRSTTASSEMNSRDATPLDARDKKKLDQQVALINKFEEKERKSKKTRSKRKSGDTSNNIKSPVSAGRATFSDTSEVKPGITGGSSVSLPTTPALHHKPKYVNSGTSHGQANSQTTSLVPQTSTSENHSNMLSSTQPAGDNYVHRGTQVDMDADDSRASPGIPTRPILTWTKRMLKRCHEKKVERDRLREEYLKSANSSASPTASESLIQQQFSNTTNIVPTEVEAQAQDVKSSSEDHNLTASATSPHAKLETSSVVSEDAQQMQGVESNGSPQPKVESPQMSAPSLPSPSEVKTKDEAAHTNGFRSTGLQLKLPSPSHEATMTSSGTTPMTVAQSPILQTPTAISNNPLMTPTSSLAQPSPAKKKMSLGDYMSRRSSNIHKVDTANPGNGSIDKEHSPINASIEMLKPPLETLAEEAKEKGADSSSAIVDETPKAEIGDPMALDAPSA